MCRIFILICTLILAIQNVDAKVYKWVDENGQTHYTQTPPPNNLSSKPKNVSTLDINNRKSNPGNINPKYCNDARKYATKVAQAAAKGIPSHQITSYISSYDEQLKTTFGVDDPILKQITYYVYGLGKSILPHDAGKLVYNQCMNGSFGGAEASRGGGGSRTSGTGWVASSGHIVTNQHVVGNNKTVTVVLSNGENLQARVVEVDYQNDLALLALNDPSRLPDGLPLASGLSGLGTEVFTIGFPHPDVMGSKPKLTTGVISSVNGLKDDPRTYQISVPVQAGNSGGPLINRQGEVVGVVVAKLSAVKMFDATGDLPQNVNYAVKINYLRALVARNSASTIAVNTHTPGQDQLAEIAQRVEGSVVIIKAN